MAERDWQKAIDRYHEWVDAGNGTDEDRRIIAAWRAAFTDLKTTFEGIG